MSRIAAAAWLWVRRKLGGSRPGPAYEALQALKMGVSMESGLYARLTDGNASYMAKSNHLSQVAMQLQGVPDGQE